MPRSPVVLDGYLVIVTAAAVPDCRDAVDHLFMDDPNVKRYSTHVVSTSSR